MNKYLFRTSLGVIAVAILAGLWYGTGLQKYLVTQIVPDAEQDFEKTMRITIPDDTAPGDYTFAVEATDEQGTVLASSETIQLTVVGSSGGATATPPSSGSGGGGGSSSGGDGGSGGGGGGGEPEVQPLQRAIFYPMRGHEITGVFSGIIAEGNRRVARLGTNTARLTKRNVRMDRDDYWMFISTKHDLPRPIQMAVYVNGKAWKVITLEKGDNQYHTQRIGKLREFLGGTVAFRLVNDTYDKSDPFNEDKDRNVFIEWWGLSNRSDPASLSVGGAGRLPAAKLTGWQLLPQLNQTIREELGEQYVTFDIWKYYAWRLAVPASHKASISQETDLRAAMRYWKGIRPQQPRGDYL